MSKCKYSNCKELMETIHGRKETMDFIDYIEGKGKNYCLFHSREEEKGPYFYKALYNVLDNAQNNKKMINLSDIYFPSEDGNSRIFKLFSIVETCENAIFNTELKFLNNPFNGISFTGSEFREPVTFDKSTFKSNCNFSGVIFRKDVTFSNVKFEESEAVNFTNIKCESIMNNSSRKKAGEKRDAKDYIKFSNCEFNYDVDFSGSVFEHNFILENIRNSHGKFTFSGATFYSSFKINYQDENKRLLREEIDFTDTNFHGTTEFENIKFEKAINFSNCHSTKNAIIKFHNVYFSTYVDFRSAKFDSNIEFTSDNNPLDNAENSQDSSTIFSRQLSFNGSLKLRGEVLFRNCIFEEAVNLSGLKYHSSTEFENCIFEKDSSLDLTKTTFLIKAPLTFNNCNVKGESKFSGSTFGADVVFNNKTNFDKTLNFGKSKEINRKTTFKGQMVLENVTLNDGADFNNATFSKGLKADNVTIIGSGLNLSGIEVEELGIELRTKSVSTNINLLDSNVVGDLKISNMRGSKLNLEDSVTTGDCDFTDCSLRDLSCCRTVIGGNLILDNVTQKNGSIDFSSSVIKKEGEFSNIIFESINFANTIFKGSVSISSKKDIDPASSINFDNTLLCGEKTELNNTPFKNGVMKDCIINGKYDFNSDKAETQMREYQGVFFVNSANFREKILKEYRFSNCFIAGCSFLRSELKDTIFSGCYFDSSEASKRLSKMCENTESEKNNYQKSDNHYKRLELKIEALKECRQNLEKLYPKKGKKERYFLDEIELMKRKGNE